jgi:ribosomal protein L37AE/L43A
MFCSKCATQLPDDAAFCYKCGTPVSGRTIPTAANDQSFKGRTKVIAAFDAKSLKCPSCGAPIVPRFGEMVITCQYCNSAITLGSEGWSSIQKHTMLPLRVTDEEIVLLTIRRLMNRGLLRRHLQENSTLEQMNLSYVPYWIIAISARTSIIAADRATQIGTIATTAALLGAMSGMGGGHGRGGGGGIVQGAVLGTVLTGGMSGGGMMRKAYQMNENHNYPVVALRALFEYQPHDFEFGLQDRIIFDASKVPKGIQILNGDVSEEDAGNQARTLVDQLQSMKAHKKYHMIQQINTQIDIGDAELLHVPVWAVRYDHKGKKMVLIIDGNSGAPIHSVGLDDESPEHLFLSS